MRQRIPPDWYPRRGEVYLAKLDKRRPALVVSADALNRFALDVCVVPITSVEHAQFSLRVLIPAGEGGLAIASWAKCDQVTTLGKTLLHIPPLGAISRASLARVELAIKRALSLP
ncbi:MAG TPA: type II toxin-antitoxin system PemK/MazF family toxin [Candidatus Acidoferrales bacterium]|nr:type II toxin-antitoxin system PemK/MazF family toxin [Candidatus Acidoferrales bacterium]